MLYELVVDSGKDELVECVLDFPHSQFAGSERMNKINIMWEGDLRQVAEKGQSHFVFVVCFSVSGEFRFFIGHVTKAGLSGKTQYAVQVV
jgi:hypothetical protein